SLTVELGVSGFGNSIKYYWAHRVLCGKIRRLDFHFLHHVNVGGYKRTTLAGGANYIGAIGIVGYLRVAQAIHVVVTDACIVLDKEARRRSRIIGVGVDHTW